VEYNRHQQHGKNSSGGWKMKRKEEGLPKKKRAGRKNRKGAETEKKELNKPWTRNRSTKHKTWEKKGVTNAKGISTMRG